MIRDLLLNFYSFCGLDYLKYAPNRLPAWSEISKWTYFSLGEAALVAVFALVLTVLRYRVQDFAAKHAHRIGIATESVKFSESVWKALFYVVSFVLGALVLFSEDWVAPTTKLWNNVASEIGQPMQQLRRKLSDFSSGYLSASAGPAFVMCVALFPGWRCVFA